MLFVNPADCMNVACCLPAGNSSFASVAKRLDRSPQEMQKTVRKRNLKFITEVAGPKEATEAKSQILRPRLDAGSRLRAPQDLISW